MESVVCPLCGEAKARTKWSKRGATSVQCIACGLVYENPRLDKTELKKFYSDESYYVSTNPEAPTSGYNDYYAQCSPVLIQEYFQILSSNNRKSGRVRYLDIGCGPGGVIQEAVNAGWDASGIELSEWSVEQGKQKGLSIVEGTLEDLRFPDGAYDVISMFDVLEHLPNPITYLKEIHRVLSPGGVVVVETPNVAGVLAHLLYKENSDLVKPRAHICLYSPKTAAHLFETVSFSDVKISTFPWCRRFTPGYFKSLILSRLLRKEPKTQLTWNESMRIIAWK